MKAERALAHAFLEANPEQTATFLEAVSVNEASAFLGTCSDAVAARALEQMEPSVAGPCLARKPAESVPAVVAALNFDKMVRLLRAMEPAEQKRVLELVPLEVATPLRQTLRFPDGTVGMLMDPTALALPADIASGEAQRRIRRESKRVRYYVYAVDRAGVLVGVVKLRELLLAPASCLLGAIMHPATERISVSASLAAAAAHPAWERFNALPVVDERAVLLGVLSRESLQRTKSGKTSPRSSDPILLGLGLVHLYWVATAELLGRLLSAAVPAPTVTGSHESRP